MRQVVLDTETTGLEPEAGHRVIEVGAVEIVDRRLTGKVFHSYLNPDRAIDEAAQAVHGISVEFLADKPRFGDIIDALLDFVEGAELIIHNAAFDMAFLQQEFAGLRPARPFSAMNIAGTVDSLLIARQKHPGQKNSLTALCRRYAVADAHRTQHGALLDAQLLAEVYLAMTGGQTSLLLAGGPERAAEQSDVLTINRLSLRRAALTVVQPDAAERVAHALVVTQLERSGTKLWRALIPDLD